MFNWLGQELKVGSVVGRGARDGNTSTFKIGRIIKLDFDKDKVQVEWYYDSMETSIGGPFDKQIGLFPTRKHLGFRPYEYWVKDSKSWCGVETVFVLSEEVLDKAKRVFEYGKDVHERAELGMDTTRQEWLDTVASL